MATSSQLVIKSYTPFKFWLKVCLITLLAGVSGWLVYMYGYYRAGFDNVELYENRDRLAKKIDNLEQFNKALREKNAVLEQSKRIDKETFSNVDSTIQRLQDQNLELSEQVAFYRGIVAPTESASGVAIAELKIRPVGHKGGYHFKLVLTQTKQGNRIVRGSGQLYIEGLLEGYQKRLNLTQISNRKKREFRLKFKYFQTIEGDVVLPDDFVPSSVLIDIKPKGKGYSRVKKTYDWADITS